MNASRTPGKIHLWEDDPRPAGPGTLGGRYLRSFWQPIYHCSDLPSGRAVPLQIMSEEFTLYRGQSGQPYLVGGRCPHRGTRLSTGWVQGEQIRCLFHGWKFDASGQCVEQPAENSRFADRICIASHPLREYLGMIFAYLGEGDPPEFPRYPEFERFEGMVELDSYLRECNYYQNLENALDMAHVGFVHADNVESFEGIGHGSRLKAEESNWGVRYTFTRDDGKLRIQQFGMPNIFHPMALPTDPEIGWQESMFWWVPIDDERHMQFSIHRLPAVGELAERVTARREARRSKIDLAHQEICEAIVNGRMPLSSVDPERVDLVRLQDDIAQVGQGRYATVAENLARSDVGVVMLRRLWARELGKLKRGEALTTWKRDGSVVPEVWGFSGLRPSAQQALAMEDSPIIDIRPFVEVDLQLKALHGEPRRF